MNSSTQRIIILLPWLVAVVLLVVGVATGADADSGEFVTAYFGAGDFVTGAFVAGEMVAGAFASGLFEVSGIRRDGRGVSGELGFEAGGEFRDVPIKLQKVRGEWKVSDPGDETFIPE